MATKKQLNQTTKTAPIVAIVGGTGRTGRWVVKGALERGYVVRALARTPSKIEKNGNDNLTVIKGDATNLESIKELLSGADTVLSCLGTVKKPHYIVESGISAILAAFEVQDKKPKLVHMSAVGLGSSRDQCKKSLVWSLIVNLGFPLIGKELFADMERGENLIIESDDVDFVIARAAILSGKEARGYKVQRPQEPVGKMMISRKDIANFMLDVVEDQSYNGEAISLFSK